MASNEEEDLQYSKNNGNDEVWKVILEKIPERDGKMQSMK